MAAVSQGYDTPVRAWYDKAVDDMTDSEAGRLQAEAERDRYRSERDLLFRDLRQSYERNHQWTHAGKFSECGKWECKNRREKMAEWEAALATPAGEGGDA